MQRHYVEHILDEFAVRSITYDVYIIANTREKTLEPRLQEIRHASLDEFFSRTEFSEIASAIFDVFGYVKVFYSELDFIKYALEHHIKREECLVYNLARDGTAPGKKSLVPAICDLLGLRYTGSNAFVISLLRNKFVYTSLLHQHGIPVPQTWLINAEGEFQDSKPSEGQRIIVKNIQESASIGLTSENVLVYQNNPATQKKLAELCERMGATRALVQEYISGIECETLVLESNGHYQALDPVAIHMETGEILSNEASNSYCYSFSLLENCLSLSQCQQICRFAEAAADLLEVENYARFDFRIDPQRGPFLIDIAGTPYTIHHSSISYLFQKIYGFSYRDIYKVIAFLALQKQ